MNKPKKPISPKKSNTNSEFIILQIKKPPPPFPPLSLKPRSFLEKTHSESDVTEFKRKKIRAELKKIKRLNSERRAEAKKKYRWELAMKSKLSLLEKERKSKLSSLEKEQKSKLSSLEKERGDFISGASLFLRKANKRVEEIEYLLVSIENDISSLEREINAAPIERDINQLIHMLQEKQNEYQSFYEKKILFIEAKEKTQSILLLYSKIKFPEVERKKCERNLEGYYAKKDIRRTIDAKIAIDERRTINARREMNKKKREQLRNNKNKWYQDEKKNRYVPSRLRSIPEEGFSSEVSGNSSLFFSPRGPTIAEIGEIEREKEKEKEIDYYERERYDNV